jgi:aminocarboxymuconate-semialdehyde decarboxylase
MLENLVNRYGADHVVLGTDYPFDMGVEDPVGFVQQAKLSPLQRKQIMGTNAARLLKIDYNSRPRRRTS